MEINIVVLVAVGCFVMTILGLVSATFFARRNDDDADNIGTVISVIVAIPFFISLCYLMIRFMGKLGDTI